MWANSPRRAGWHNLTPAGVIGPRAKDLWIWIWEEVHRVHQEGILVEVEHVKAHRTKKKKQEMLLFEKFITEGNEKADEFEKYVAMMDEGEMAQVRASTRNKFHVEQDVSNTITTDRSQDSRGTTR